MSFRNHTAEEPNYDQRQCRDWEQERRDERQFQSQSHNDGGDYDAKRFHTHDYDGNPLQAEPQPIADVATERIERTAARLAITPAAETKMTNHQLQARIEQMEATEARDPMSYKPAAEARRAKLARYRAELARRPAEAEKPEAATRAALAADELGEAIRALVAIYGRPAVIDATWDTARKQPEAWR